MPSTDIVITPTDLRTEADALADAAARGLVASANNFVGKVEDWHWHDFAATVYVLEGESGVDYDDGVTLRVAAGNIFHQPAGVVHKDVPGAAYRGVFSFESAPSTWTQPINKPVL